MSVLIVGASVAGIRTAQALRMRGYSDLITVIGEEIHHPYDKPPLSKDMLLPEGDGSPVQLLSAEEINALDVQLRLGVRAAKLNTSTREISTEDGEILGFDDLVIATGVTPRTLPGATELGGIYTVRNADDASALRERLPHARHVVVVGSGFIGSEFASVASGYGADVTIVEAQDVPMAHILGSEVGALVSSLHAENGVRLLTGTSFDHFTGDGQVESVVLADGRVLPADLVVIGIGAKPAIEWLSDSGLPLGNGIECDEQLCVLGADRIYAAGDVAHWPHGLYGKSLRIEHWTNANEHADIVAASIAGGPTRRPQPPYVWSDQYGHRIQIVGRPSEGRAVSVRGGSGSEPVVAIYAGTDGVVVGAVVLDNPRLLMKIRKAIANRAQAVTLDALLDPPVSTRL